MCIRDSYETIDMKSDYLSGVGDNIKQLPTRDIVVNMDGGVGGSWYKEDAVDVPFESSPDNDEFAEMDIEDGQIELDEMEIEMYGMLCERALLNNEELPSIEDFYQWLDNGQF